MRALVCLRRWLVAGVLGLASCNDPTTATTNDASVLANAVQPDAPHDVARADGPFIGADDASAPGVRAIGRLDADGARPDSASDGSGGTGGAARDAGRDRDGGSEARDGAGDACAPACDMTVCPHEICMTLPPPLPIACLPGTTGGHVCVRLGSDQCKWVLYCTPNMNGP